MSVRRLALMILGLAFTYLLYQTPPYEQRDKLLDFMSAGQKPVLPEAFAGQYVATFAIGAWPGLIRLSAPNRSSSSQQSLAKFFPYPDRASAAV